MSEFEDDDGDKHANSRSSVNKPKMPPFPTLVRQGFFDPPKFELKIGGKAVDCTNLYGFYLREGYNQDFLLAIDITIAEGAAPKFGQDVQLSLDYSGFIDQTGGEAQREICGVINGLESYDHGHLVDVSSFHGRILVGSRFENLRLGTKIRQFQNKSVKDILGHIFGEHAIDHDIVDSILTSTLQHVVQFNESDYDFVRRLLNNAGVSYYFSHANGKEKLVVSSEESSLVHEADASKMKHVSKVAIRTERSTKSYELRGWSFETASATSVDEAHDLGVNNSRDSVSPDNTIAYPHPYNALHIGSGSRNNKVADHRLRALRRQAFEAEADITVACMSVGDRLRLSGYQEAIDGDYIIAEQEFYIGSSVGDAPQPSYGNVRLVQRDLKIHPVYKPPMLPLVGLQTAIVTDDKDPEKMGMVKVRFVLDEEMTSFWARVVQPWAGATHDAWFLPQVGDEVLVGFLHNDPDRPIIVGSLSNGKNPLHYSDVYHDEKISGIFTDSKSELRFVDKGGSELVRLYSSKDMELEAKENVLIKAGKEMKIEAADKIEILVGGSKVTIQKDGNITISAQGSLGIDAKSDVKVSGLNVNADAKAQFKVTGNAGGEVSTSAVMVVKGSLVQIN